MAFWNFIKRPTEKLGVGVSDFALIREGLPPHDSIQGRGRQVQGQLYPVLRSPQVYAPHLALPVALQGQAGGVYLSGQYLITALSDFVKAQEQNGPSN